MSIRIRYFASLRDRLERDADQIEVDEPLAVSEVWQRLNPDLPLPPQTLAALNHEYAGLDAPVRDGDELAFFPPVTGG